jgi:hypothetical protein
MNIKHLFVAGASLGLFTLTACQKEEKTAAEKVQGKWQVESVIDNEFYNGQDHKNTSLGSPDDYFDFRADGKLYSSVDGDKDTTNYAVQSDSKILVGGALGDIQTLTSSTFKLHFKDIDPDFPSEYIEATFNLKK